MKMDIDLILEILKWVGLIILAGFLGQFGKSFALHLLGRDKETTGEEPNIEPGQVADEPVDGKAIKEVVKAEKKRLKALKKQQKKEQ